MDDLRRMAVFASVVQHGSMSGAARALGMSTSAVSQQVRRLVARGVVFTGAALRREPPVMHEASLHADMQSLGARLTKTEAAAMAAMPPVSRWRR